MSRPRQRKPIPLMNSEGLQSTGSGTSNTFVSVPQETYSSRSSQFVARMNQAIPEFGGALGNELARIQEEDKLEQTQRAALGMEPSEDATKAGAAAHAAVGQRNAANEAIRRLTATAATFEGTDAEWNQIVADEQAALLQGSEDKNLIAAVGGVFRDQMAGVNDVRFKAKQEQDQKAKYETTSNSLHAAFDSMGTLAEKHQNLQIVVAEGVDMGMTGENIDKAIVDVAVARASVNNDLELLDEAIAMGLWKDYPQLETVRREAENRIASGEAEATAIQKIEAYDWLLNNPRATAEDWINYAGALTDSRGNPIYSQAQYMSEWRRGNAEREQMQRKAQAEKAAAEKAAKDAQFNEGAQALMRDSLVDFAVANRLSDEEFYKLAQEQNDLAGRNVWTSAKMQSATQNMQAERDRAAASLEAERKELDKMYEKAQKEQDHKYKVEAIFAQSQDRMSDASAPPISYLLADEDKQTKADVIGMLDAQQSQAMERFRETNPSQESIQEFQEEQIKFKANWLRDMNITDEAWKKRTGMLKTIDAAALQSDGQTEFDQGTRAVIGFMSQLEGSSAFFNHADAETIKLYSNFMVNREVGMNEVQAMLTAQQQARGRPPVQDADAKKRNNRTVNKGVDEMFNMDRGVFSSVGRFVTGSPAGFTAQKQELKSIAMGVRDQLASGGNVNMEKANQYALKYMEENYVQLDNGWVVKGNLKNIGQKMNVPASRVSAALDELPQRILDSEIDGLVVNTGTPIEDWRPRLYDNGTIIFVDDLGTPVTSAISLVEAGGMSLKDAAKAAAEQEQKVRQDRIASQEYVEARRYQGIGMGGY